MMNPFTLFNKWYDNKKEPFRFLFFLLVFAIPFTYAQATILEPKLRKLTGIPVWINFLIIGIIISIVISRILSHLKKSIR